MRQVSLHNVLTVALESAEKHEASPSVLKRSRFRTKIDMGSVSAAERDMLELFHVEFHDSQHSDLRTVITERFYTFDPEDHHGIST
jgi:hypothetical protein